MTRPKFVCFAGALLFVAASSGCVEIEEPGTDEPTTDASQPISGGYNAPEDTATVGIVSLDGFGGGICTGSLIAPNLVLTARHCVAPSPQQIQCGGVSKFGPITNPANVYVTTNPYFTQNGSDYTLVDEIVQLPNETDAVCGNDVVLMILKTNVPESVAVPYVPRVDEPILAQEEFSAIGFGATDDNGNGAGQRRRRDGLSVVCVGQAECQASYVVETEWQGNEGICSGDSGGPAIDSLGRVMGITSRGLTGCYSPVYGSTQSWGEWIKEVAIDAADRGGYEAPAWALGGSTNPEYAHPTGDACTDGTTCPSGLCVDGLCSRKCADWAPCDEGWTCGGDGVCVPPVQEEPQGEPDPEETGSGSGDSGGGGDEGGCAFSPADADPTNPIPWKTGAMAVALGLWIARRRR